VKNGEYVKKRLKWEITAYKSNFNITNEGASELKKFKGTSQYNRIELTIK
jgi:hypothetical protein